MKVLDLFCGAGGAAMGLHRAWPDAEITGVDIKPQPRYPFTFVRGDAMRPPFDLSAFDFIWASPVCKRYSPMTQRWDGRAESHPDQIPELRERLRASGVPYAIENVIGSPLLAPFILCGSMFGLKLRRHRGFETSFEVGATPPCRHDGPVVGVYGHAGGTSKRDGLKFGGVDTWRDAMDIHWMTGNELAQAVPPAYSEFIARRFLDVNAQKEAA